MNVGHQRPLFEVWLHRLIGSIWSLGGLWLLFDLHRSYWWEQRTFWLPVLAGLTYLSTGIGFSLGRGWARKTMVALAVVAGLFFADMILMGGWVGNRILLHWMLPAFCFAGFTILFVWISAISKWSDSHPA
jgi:hypothetical protein